MMITDTYKSEGVGIRMREKCFLAPRLISIAGVRKIKTKWR